MNDNIKLATYLALTTALISGTNNFLSKIAISVIKNPLVFTALKNSLVAVGLLGLLMLLTRWRELARLNRRQWLLLAAVGVIGGGIPFALFFTGLAQTSAINAGLIHKTLFVWVILLALPLLGEKISRLQLLAVTALFGANLLVGGFAGFRFNSGELMIFIATLLWAIENIIAKIALRGITSLTLAAMRMTIGSVLLAMLVAAQGNWQLAANLTGQQWLWTIIPSVLLLGYVTTWYKALSLAPAGYVATLLVPATLVTNLLSAVFLTHAVNGRDLLGMALFTVGTGTIIWITRRSARTLAPGKNAVTTY